MPFFSCRAYSHSTTLSLMLARSFLALLLLTAPALSQLPGTTPAIDGFVTNLLPGGGFEVEATPILLTPATHLFREQGKLRSAVDHLDPPYFGQSMQVWGRIDKKTHVLIASDIVQFPPSIAEVHGGAMIDLVPPAAAPDRIFRADGYYLHLTPQTILNFNPPLTSLADLTTNVWLEYRGIQQRDGSVILSAAEAWPNTVPKAEEKLRVHDDFDPASVDESDKQSGSSKFWLGYDNHRLPAHHDQDLQDRITRIGQSLVPAYQKALPDNDPTRIPFRFQVVETDHFRDAIAFANGIILVPWPAISRLENDSQIAAVLADNIAVALEKQTLLHQPAQHAMTAANIAGTAAGFILPGAGLATGLTTWRFEAHAVTEHERQSGRVALALMHDAGYDLHQAPVAWRLLQTKHPTRSSRLRSAAAPTTSTASWARPGWKPLPSRLQPPDPPQRRERSPPATGVCGTVNGPAGDSLPARDCICVSD